MKKPIFKKGFAFIYLCKSIYDKDTIISTSFVYKEFFKTSISEIGNYFIVKIEPATKEHTIKTLANEFLNYILSEEYTTKRNKSKIV